MDRLTRKELKSDRFALEVQHSVQYVSGHRQQLVRWGGIAAAVIVVVLSFPTAADRQKAVVKAFTELAAKYSGSDEGTIAQYMLATNAADQANLTEAEKRLKTVVDSGNASYGSLAKLSLASIYAGEGKQAEGEKLIQSLIDHPTVMVSKELATISLAELIANSDPARARKMLEPLRGSPRPNVSKAALTALSDLPQK